MSVDVRWPGNKAFAFTIFDDPDAQSVEVGKRIYGLLGDLGFRTTRGVWPGRATRTPNSHGATCDDPEYRAHTQALQAGGFEVGYHNHTKHSAMREEIVAGLAEFREYFGHDPVSMANHYNADAIYWGPARLTPPLRGAYIAATFGRTRGRHFGDVPGHPSFWGDMCRDRIRYCRNFVYRNPNTLAACPWMPYHDQTKPFVNAWFASTEASNAPKFVDAISEGNQDRLEAEGGACILYTHFGHGFVRDRAIPDRVCELLRRLSGKNGWFVPVSTLLDHLRDRSGIVSITPAQRRALEARWLFEKLVRGAS